MSAEDRQADRRRRLLESCLDVVGDLGVAGTTVDRVCAEASLTKRYFYESYADLDALLLAAADELFTETLRRMQDVVAAHPGEDHTHGVVLTLVDVLSEDPRVARLYAECPSHPVLRARREEAITAFTTFVATDVLAPPAVPITDARRLIATRMLVAGTTDLVTSWLAGDIEADRDAIVETIERLGGAV
jgi:AcrR family transcriptional regulator